VTEAFLYFLWQFQYYDHTDLLTTEGELVQILHPGFRNANAGPDFLNARLLINDVEWVGSVEAHTKASDWLAHKHQHDRAYDNVILHIVWTDDRLPQTNQRRPTRTDGSTMPTLELQARTGSDLLSRYNTLTESPNAIPCAGQFRVVQPLRITAMLDKAMLQRLERQATAMLAFEVAPANELIGHSFRDLGVPFHFAPMPSGTPAQAVLTGPADLVDAFHEARVFLDAHPDRISHIGRDIHFRALFQYGHDHTPFMPGHGL